MDTLLTLLSYPGLATLAVVALIALIFYKRSLRLLGFVIVPDDSIGTVTKNFVLFGRHKELPPGRIVALYGEAGLQADTLAPGLHLGLWPWQYQVDLVKSRKTLQITTTHCTSHTNNNTQTNLNTKK